MANGQPKNTRPHILEDFSADYVRTSIQGAAASVIYTAGRSIMEPDALTKLQPAVIGDTPNFSGWTDEPEKSDEDESVFVHEPDSALCQVDIKPVQLQELEVVWVGAEEDIQRTTVPFSKYSEAATASSEQDYSVETEKIQETSESLDNYVEPVTTTAKVDATPSTQPKIRGDSVEQNGPVAAKEAQPKYLNIVPHKPTGRREVKS